MRKLIKYFVQGCIITADTENQARTVNVESDGETLQEALSLQHNGRDSTAFAFDTPFITHLLRAMPTNTPAAWLYKVEWIWEPAPESADRWVEDCRFVFRHSTYALISALKT